MRPDTRRGPVPPTPGPDKVSPASSTTTSITGRGDVVSLAAWKLLRGRPDGGDWFGGRRLWCWDEAERSRGWPA